LTVPRVIQFSARCPGRPKSRSKNVEAAILAAGSRGFQPGGKNIQSQKTFRNNSRNAMAAFFPGGKMPPSTAGKDACRDIIRPALSRGICFLSSGLRVFCGTSNSSGV
jgi:hypothetical protein